MALGAVRSRRRTESGAAALEFALVMPVLLVLIFGLIQYGIYFWAYQAGADAARQAARSAAVGDYPKNCTAFKKEISDALKKFKTNTPTITRTYQKLDSTKGVQPGDTVVVTVKYQSTNLNFPFLPFVKDGIVDQTAEARVDNVTDSTAVNC